MNQYSVGIDVRMIKMVIEADDLVILAESLGQRISKLKGHYGRMVANVAKSVIIVRGKREAPERRWRLNENEVKWSGLSSI